MNFHEAACCGDFCGKCPNYPLACVGCVPQLHPDCHFISCSHTRGLAHCGLCDDLPCQRLTEFVPDDRRGCPPGYHIANLRRRRALGTEAWLVEQRRRWCR